MADPVSIFTPSKQSIGPLTKLRAQAEELEGTFLNTLMSEMFSSIDTRGQFGGGFAEETWRSMQSEQFAGAMANAGGIGLADQLVSQLMQLQEAQGVS
jgi:flagellar protein FlgJ